MRAQSIGGAGVFGVKAALVELLTQLRHAAVNGVVPEHAFAESVRTLELGDAERERLRDELARMGLLVQGVHVHTDADSASAEKVARFREENMFPRFHAVRGLLSRYADAEGYVTARAVDGVARLAGLDANEAVALRAEARLRPTAVVAEEQPEELEPAGAPEPLGPAGLQAAREAGDLAAAEAAALAVLEEDRFRRRPEDHLLSAEAEVGLAVLVRGGPSRIGCEPEKAELSGLPPDDIRVGARNCLVVHNQRLAHSILRGYLEQGLEYDDLFQHGVLGLMTAARKFDPTKGYKFSTYATWWVRQAITRAVADEGAVIRIPVHMHEQIRKVARAERTLNGLGKPASSADVAVLCDISLAKVEEARRLSRRTDSLDRVVGDGVTLGDFVGFRRPLPSVEGMVLNMLDVEEALAVLDTFSGRDHRILVRRLGLDGDEPSTLDELGREFGVTRERIRQIESKLRPVLKERLRTATHFEADRVPQGEDAQEGRHRNGVGVVRARNQARLRVAAGAVAQPKKREVAVCADLVPESAPVIDVERAPPVPLSEPDAVTAAHAALVAVPEPGSGAESCAAERYTCDWEEARRMTEAPVGDVNWLAKYALTAVGHVQLAVLLGQSATDAVMRSFQVTETVDPPIVASLEVLRRVFDALIESRHRPEDFFERPAEVLVGTTPRAYLAAKPLVYAESRLAMRDALREFMTEMPRKPDPAMETEHAVEVDGQEAAAEASLTEVRRAHEAYVEQLRQEHRQQLDAERQTAALRIAAAGVDAEAQLDALEDALLLRMDKSLLRRERSALAQAEERIACSEAVHREAYQTAMQRADGAEKRLRQYREDAEAHIAALEVRLRQSESKLAQQDQEVRAARQEAQDAEQRAAQRIAKTERDAWARITELQEELAVERGVANGPSWLRDHRRPS